MSETNGPDRPDAAPPRGAAPDPDTQNPAAPDLATPDLATPDLATLAGDWITLWQSELAAMAADRELQEGWQTLAALWAGAAEAALSGLPRGGPGGGPFGATSGRGGPDGHERADRRAGTAAPARPAPAAAAPDPRDAEIERLHRRIDALESRLAELEAGRPAAGGGRGDRRRAARKRD